MPKGKLGEDLAADHCLKNGVIREGGGKVFTILEPGKARSGIDIQ